MSTVEAAGVGDADAASEPGDLRSASFCDMTRPKTLRKDLWVLSRASRADTDGEDGHAGNTETMTRDDDDFGGAGGVWYGAKISDAVIDVGDPWGLRDAEWAIADVPYGFW